jgi:hypothetical protein
MRSPRHPLHLSVMRTPVALRPEERLSLKLQFVPISSVWPLPANRDTFLRADDQGGITEALANWRE